MISINLHDRGNSGLRRPVLPSEPQHYLPAAAIDPVPHSLNIYLVSVYKLLVCLFSTQSYQLTIKETMIVEVSLLALLLLVVDTQQRPTVINQAKAKVRPGSGTNLEFNLLIALRNRIRSPSTNHPHQAYNPVHLHMITIHLLHTSTQGPSHITHTTLSHLLQYVTQQTAMYHGVGRIPSNTSTEV